jgi:hypothetical protein
MPIILRFIRRMLISILLPPLTAAIGAFLLTLILKPEDSESEKDERAQHDINGRSESLDMAQASDLAGKLSSHVSVAHQESD